MRFKQITFINTSVLLFFLIGFILSTLGFPYLQYIAGILVFFLPGINLGWLIEMLSNQKLGQGKLLIWTIATSPIIVSLFTYAGILINKSQFSENFILGNCVVLVFLTFIATITTQLITKNDVTILACKKIRTETTFWWILSLILIFLGINFILYKFIPEADGYTYLIQLRDLMGQGNLPSNLARPLFISFSLAINSLTQIPFYWIFKLAITILVSSIFLPFYFIAREKYSSKIAIALISLLPFSIPVISLEILYSRPQSIFILSFVLFLYLAIEILKLQNESAKIYFLTTLLALSLIGTKMHEFFLFLVLIIGFSLFLALLPIIKRKPKESALFAIISLIGISGWINNLGIINQFGSYLKLFSSFILHPELRLWFISNYTNIDGSAMGWPGLSWVFYYGYNLGLVMPAIIFFAFFKKFKGFKTEKQSLLILALAFLLFFSIAEIFPRLGLAFYPDRAWLFVSLSAVLVIAFCLPNNIKLSKIQKYLIFTLFLLSISTSFALTYAKQGWTTPNEYEAAQFMQNNLPKDAIILSQGGNGPMINYFAERTLVVPPDDFFSTENQAQINDFIKNLPTTLGKQAELDTAKNDMLSSSHNLIDSLKKSNYDINNIEKELNKKILNYDTLLKTEDEIKRKKLDEPHPVYILYSNEKFTGLYGSRQWWKDGNFFGANLTKVNQTFSSIYNKNNIFIWKAN